MNIEVTDGGDVFVFLCQSTGNVRKIDRFDSHIKRVTRLLSPILVFLSKTVYSFGFAQNCKTSYFITGLRLTEL